MVAITKSIDEDAVYILFYAAFVPVFPGITMKIILFFFSFLFHSAGAVFTSVLIRLLFFAKYHTHQEFHLVRHREPVSSEVRSPAPRLLH